MDEKTRKVVQFKDAQYGDAGTVKAIFATLNVVDHHGDMMLPGSIGDQKVRLSTWGHGSWQGGLNGLPVGKGRIYESGGDAIFEGKFFLETNAGSEVYKTVKALGDLQEWSFALPEIDSENRSVDGQTVRAIKRVRVPEVSPVLLGAGIDTRTLDIKSIKTAIGAHSTATDDGAWDAGANVKRVRADEPSGYYARIYAWKDPEGETGVKSTYKFPHHFVGESGDPGKASTRACSAGIAALNGGRGGTKIPDADRKGAWGHLARHLKDADQEPSELRAEMAEPGDMKLVDHADWLLAQAIELADRVKSVADLREGENRHPSAETMKRASAVSEALKEVARMLDDVRGRHDAMARELVRFQQQITERR